MLQQTPVAFEHAHYSQPFVGLAFIQRLEAAPPPVTRRVHPYAVAVRASFPVPQLLAQLVFKIS